MTLGDAIWNSENSTNKIYLHSILVLENKNGPKSLIGNISHFGGI